MFLVQLIHVQAELNQMHVENERLRDGINQVNNNYNDLKMHLATLLTSQHRQIRNGKNDKDHEVVLQQLIKLRKLNPSLN